MAWFLPIASALSLAAAAFWPAVVEAPILPPAAPAEAALWPGATAWAHAGLDTLSIDEKAGQLVVARLDGEVDAEALRLASAGRLGGIERAIPDEGAHLDVLRRWQTEAAVPLLVVERSGPSPRGGALPPPMLLGAAGRPDLTYLSGRAAAEAAVTLGIQIPASPLFAAPGATPFGDPSLDGTPLGVSLVRGLRDGRVLPSASVAGPAVDPSLRPLVQAGLMTVRVPLGAFHPASEAVEAIHALRTAFDFNGLVVVEAAPGTSPQALAEAVAAGADAVITSDPQEAGRSLAAAARAGALPDGRLDEAVRRVLSVKAWSGLDAITERTRPGERTGPVVRVFPWRPLASPFLRHAALLEQDVARNAVTVIQDEGGPLPLVGPAAPRRVLTVLLDPSVGAEAGLPFANAISMGADEGIAATFIRLGLGASEDRYVDAAASTRSADVVVVGLFGADGVPAARHRAFVGDLLASGRTVVLAAFGEPSLVAGLPRPDALVAAYTDTEAAQRAAAEAVVGQIDVGGRLPVPVVGLAPAGAGVRLAQQTLRAGTAEEAGLSAEAVESVQRLLEAAVRSGAFPGASVAIGRAGVLVELGGVGSLTRGGAPVTPETAYDLASLTKVVGTTATVMRLVERGDLDLDARVSTFVPDYQGPGKEAVTVRHLLTHSAGHRPFYPFYAHDILRRDEVLRFIHADTLQYRPGAQSVYSDFDMILLGEIIEAVTGRPLDRAFEDEVFRPLGMGGTGFREPGDVDPTAAPTEADRVFRGRTLQGEVHDEAAWVMGGVAGHAGLFSTAHDLARFGFALANGGEAYGTRLFRRSTIDRFTERVRLRSTYPMGLGWMLQQTDRSYSSAGALFGPRSFGHTGFTGTSIWVDPDQELFVVLLSNRVHPSRQNTRIRSVRADLADAVAGAIRTTPGEAARGWGFGAVPDDLPTLAATPARNPAFGTR